MDETSTDGKLNKGQPRIMLVEDDEAIRETICELLASEGIEIIAVAGGNECLNRLSAGFRGLILMDVMMPGMDGWTTIREMKNAGLLEGNIISMLTSMEVPDQRMEGLQEIIIDYILKPFEPSAFITSVKKYLLLLEQTAGHK